MALVVCWLRGRPRGFGLGGSRTRVSRNTRAFNSASAAKAPRYRRAINRTNLTISLRSSRGIDGFLRFAFVATMSHHGAFGGMLEHHTALADCA
jgi:hypothetical protein